MALATRNYDLVGRAVLKLRALHATSEASYYEGLIAVNSGLMEDGAHLMRRAFDNASSRRGGICSRSLLVMGNVELCAQNLDSARRFYREAIALDSTGRGAAQATKMMGVTFGMEGSHIHALKTLQTAWPMINRASALYPPLIVDYLNALAIEVAANGYAIEALSIIRVAAQSPFARYHPETWNTVAELQRGEHAPRLRRFRVSTARILAFPRRPAKGLSDRDRLRLAVIRKIVQSPDLPATKLGRIEAILRIGKDIA